MYFGENETQSELYIPEDSENVNFDNSTGFTISVKQFYSPFKVLKIVTTLFSILYSLWINTYSSRKENKSKRKRQN